MDAHKTPDPTKRLAKVLLSSGDLGRPIISSPGTPADRVMILREAFTKTMNDHELIADAKKRKWDLDPLNGAELEATAKEVVIQPREVVERLKALLAK
jgi:tripartite-type tricarboxylate transporter receptor subunit TctC